MAELEIGTRVADAIPAEIHGCRVRVGVGPYPPDAEHTHRKAMYAELVPVTTPAKNRMRMMNRSRILGMIPLTNDGVILIEQDPQGAIAEQAALDALREAARSAKGLDD